MQAYFKGWRPKVGCALLLLAIVIGMACVRSHFISDKVTVPGWQTASEIKSFDGYIALTWQSPGRRDGNFTWKSEAVSDWREVFLWSLPDSGIDLHWGGLVVGSAVTGMWSHHTGGELTDGEVRTHFWAVSYLLPVSLVTIIAGWLLLSRLPIRMTR